jgi:hypothetical protein
MRRFVWGLVLGFGLTYGYYEWDYYTVKAKAWFADASSAPDADEKVDRLFSRSKD